jgi:hypothetical protein
VIQGEGPEFKPQYCKKKKKRRRKIPIHRDISPAQEIVLIDRRGDNEA